MVTGKAWTKGEQIAVMAAYLVILEREQNGGPVFNKAAMRRATLPLLDGRSPGSYEMKMCNISAALHAAGRSWINGYKPLGNAQKSLDAIAVEVATMAGQLIRAADDNRLKPENVPPLVFNGWNRSQEIEELIS